MKAKIINGIELAAQIKAQVKIDAERFYQEKKRKIGLAVILVGDNPASQIYVKNKIKACEECFINSFEFFMPEKTKEDTLIELIIRLNNDENVDGILVQLPLPAHIRQGKILSYISPQKDADGFLAVNAGNLMLGNPSLNACTPCGILELIKSTGESVEGKQAVVIGRSNIVGKPVALMLLEANATVTLCHSHTLNFVNFSRHADILVVAVGQKDLIKGYMIKPGAIVIDVGMNREDGKLYGDCDFDSVREVAGYITPVPGGVGPMTIAMLLKNVTKAGVFEDELILQEINVTGEILEFKISAGNTYILLKEDGCVLNCVYFSSAVEYQIGQKVCLSGSVRFYHKSGKVSFIVTAIKILGQGELLAALKLTKEKLAKEGVFSNARPLPGLVTKLALITSADGAVLHDFIKTAKPLNYLIIKIFATKVQGEGASDEIADTLSDINSGKFGIFDAIVIARGGGSAMDLSEFNNEKLARKIRESGLTVISAIGHEVDYTLCDFAADIRACTPTKAAEIILSNNKQFFGRLSVALDVTKSCMIQMLNTKLASLSVLTEKIAERISRKNQKKINFAIYEAMRIHRRLEVLMEKYNNKIDRLNQENYVVLNTIFMQSQNKLSVLSAASKELNPLKVLAKGYAKIYKNQSEISGIKQLLQGDRVEILMVDGSVSAKID
ncbi:c-1-tetrahydrofolate synthase cytoplasmic-related [Holotrichia oblita]|nr:c-1-tetrahydrofolate synthase cytoplasmic-related [Holotrichia oblita]